MEAQVFTSGDSTFKGQDFAVQNHNRLSIIAVPPNLWDFSSRTGIKQVGTIYWSSWQWQRHSNGTKLIRPRDHLLCV
jgi:hypothetical protein